MHGFGRNGWWGENDGCEIRRYMHGFERNGWVGGKHDGCEIRRYMHGFGRDWWVGEYDGCEIRRYIHGEKADFERSMMVMRVLSSPFFIHVVRYGGIFSNIATGAIEFVDAHKTLIIFSLPDFCRPIWMTSFYIVQPIVEGTGFIFADYFPQCWRLFCAIRPFIGLDEKMQVIWHDGKGV
jgi:hypothetical protein